MIHGVKKVTFNPSVGCFGNGASHVNQIDQRQQQHNIKHDKHDDDRIRRQDVVCVEGTEGAGVGGVGTKGVGTRIGSHGDGVDGKRMSDRVFRSSFVSNAYTTTTNTTSVYDDNMTTTENDDIARRATYAGHGEDLCPSFGGSAIQEAGGDPKWRPSVPAPGLVSRDVPASTVLPAFQQPAACTGNSACTPPRSQVYGEQHMPRPPVVVGTCKQFFH